MTVQTGGYAFTNESLRILSVKSLQKQFLIQIMFL